MRMQHWSKWVIALLVNAACVATSHAQEYPGGAGSYYGAPQTTTATPGGVPMEAGQYTGYSTDYGAYPVAPWPEVSPFDNSLDQTYWENGLWYRRTNREQNRMYFGLEYFNAKLKRPKTGQPSGLVGSPIVNEDNVYEWIVRELVGQPQNAPEKDQTMPFYTEELGSDEARPSVRGRIGETFADGSGWELAAFYAPGDEQKISFGPAVLNRKPRFDLSNGEGIATFRGAFVISEVFPDLGALVFDQGVIMAFDSEAWGTDLNFYTTPIGSHEEVSQFQGSFGLRYLGLTENFSWWGSDSGFQDRVQWLPDGRAYLVSPFTTRVRSRMLSNLLGPQLGVKWTLGGDNFKIITEAKGSIAINFEENELEYNAYGLQPNNEFVAADDSPFGFFNSDLRPGDPRDGQESDVRVDWAPIFEVSATAEMGFMEYMPVLNKLPGFRDSKFRFGYVYTQVWRMRRAAQAVDYFAPYPVLNDDRESWHVGGWTAGFVWTR